MNKRKSRQERIADSLDREFFRAIIDQVRDIVLVVTSTGRIIAANRAAIAGYGYSLEELRGLLVHDLRAPETRMAVDGQIQIARQEGIVFRTVHMRRNGECFPVEVSSQCFRLSAEAGVVSTVRDITASVNMEKALIESEEKLRHANKELTVSNEALVASEEELRLQFDELLAQEEKLSRHNSALISLHDIALGLIRHLDLDEVLQEILTSATRLFKVEDGFINLVDEPEAIFIRRVAAGRFLADMARRSKVTDGLLGQAYATGRIAINTSYSTWAGRFADPLFDGLHYFIVVPLKEAGKVIGALALASSEPGRTLAEHEVDLLQGFADFASVALVNAQLHSALVSSEQEIQKMYAELTAAHEELQASDEEIRQQFETLDRQANTLMESELRYQALFDNMLNGFALHEVVCGDHGEPVDYRFLLVNPAFERLTGLKSAQVVGKTVLAVFPNTEQYLIKTFGQVALTGQPCSLIEFSQELGRYFEVEAYCPESGKFAVHFLDCTDRIRQQENITYMAFHDGLTGLPNRYLFKDRLQKALAGAGRKAEKIAVILLDLDDFKFINDTLGHFAGDELLKVIGERLEAVLRQEDTVARLGGDEFVILLQDIRTIDNVIAVIRKIVQAVEEPWRFNQKMYHVTCKLGISLFPDDGQDPDLLLKQADMAMYKAKELGKGYYQHYHSSMGAQLSRRMEMEAELRKAIKEEQFILHYQPQVDYRGKLTGVEALLRWRHPVRGLIPPLEFIPLAEENGLITKIGEWVLQTACRQAADWRRLGIPPVFMAINISARQFNQQNFLRVISDKIEQSGLDPRRLILEITETVAMKNADYTVQVLQALQAMGVKIAIDDFGIGYSSFTYLKKFPVNSLKIDRSFIKDIHLNAESASIVGAILALAKKLKFMVVAEGVENVEQLKLLKELECDQMQGFIFSKPLDTSQMTKMLLSVKGWPCDQPRM